MYKLLQGKKQKFPAHNRMQITRLINSLLNQNETTHFEDIKQKKEGEKYENFRTYTF